MKKGQMNWMAMLIIAIVAGMILLYLYWQWKTKSVEGVGFIQSLLKS